MNLNAFIQMYPTNIGLQDVADIAYRGKRNNNNKNMVLYPDV